MKNKKFWLLICIATIVFLNLSAFLIPSSFTISFWITYIFLMLILIFQIFLIINNDFENKIMKKSFFGYSFSNMDTVYIILQILLLILAKFIPQIPMWLIIILNVLLFTIFLITICSSLISLDYINEIENKTKEKIDFIKSLQIDIDLISEQETNDKIKNQLTKLSEKIKFSDSISNEKLSLIEKEITEKLEELKITTHKEKIIKELNLLLEERTKKCKLYKGEK